MYCGIGLRAGPGSCRALWLLQEPLLLFQHEFETEREREGMDNGLGLPGFSGIVSILLPLGGGAGVVCPCGPVQ